MLRVKGVWALFCIASLIWWALHGSVVSVRRIVAKSWHSLDTIIDINLYKSKKFQVYSSLYHFCNLEEIQIAFCMNIVAMVLIHDCSSKDHCFWDDQLNGSVCCQSRGLWSRAMCRDVNGPGLDRAIRSPSPPQACENSLQVSPSPARRSKQKPKPVACRSKQKPEPRPIF